MINTETKKLCLLSAAAGAAVGVMVYKACVESKKLRKLERKDHTESVQQHARDKSRRQAPHAEEDRREHPIRVWLDGCFDLMHVGHANAFRQARKLGDVLIVGINSDADIIKYKGCSPLFNDEERASAVRGCRWVDELVENVPYVMDSEYLDFIFETYKIDIVVFTLIHAPSSSSPQTDKHNFYFNSQYLTPRYRSMGTMRVSLRTVKMSTRKLNAEASSKPLNAPRASRQLNSSAACFSEILKLKI
jgi:cytidyltransferase-like protein